jgi:hypothetical protein
VRVQYGRGFGSLCALMLRQQAGRPWLGAWDRGTLAPSGWLPVNRALTSLSCAHVVEFPLYSALRTNSGVVRADTVQRRSQGPREQAGMPFPIAQLGRHPKPKDLIGKLLFGAGSVLRGVGVALDGLGAAVQGPYGLQQERECCRGCQLQGHSAFMRDLRQLGPRQSRLGGVPGRIPANCSTAAPPGARAKPRRPPHATDPPPTHRSAAKHSVAAVHRQP